MSLEIRHYHGDVVLEARTWDGIDKPQRSEIERLSPVAARGVAGTIMAMADAAEQYRDKAEAEEIIRLQAEIKARQERLAALTWKGMAEGTAAGEAGESRAAQPGQPTPASTGQLPSHPMVPRFTEEG